MNSSVRTSDLQRWQACFGLCLICRQPLGLREKTRREEKLNNSKDEENEWFTAMEGLVLSEECPVRLCLMRFRLLGEREECHLIDRYTFLERPSGPDFVKLLKGYRDVLMQLPAPYALLEQQILAKKNGGIGQQNQYDIAWATCRRVADGLTISGCRACNMAMEQSSAHANAVYRCFALTAPLDIAKLETNTQENTRIKKFLQQIALYFEWQSTQQQWIAKREDVLLRDTFLWRCIAHLFCWGRNNHFRFRLVAIFHAANYLFEGSRFKGAMTLEDWHLHIFRPFYMRSYAFDTWFGMHQREIGTIFDFQHKHGLRWTVFVCSHLEEAGQRLTELSVTSLTVFKENVLSCVHSERELLAFLAHKQGIAKGLRIYMAYFLFHAQSETSLSRHCERFMHEMCKTFRQLPAVTTMLKTS